MSKEKLLFDNNTSRHGFLVVLVTMFCLFGAIGIDSTLDRHLVFAESHKPTYITFDETDSEMVFDYPDSWQVKNSASLLAYFTTHEHLSDLDEAVILADTYSMDPYNDLFDYVESQNSYFPSNDFQVISKTQTSMDGRQAYKIKLTTGKDFDPSLTGLLVLSETNNKIYSIGFMAKSDEFSKHNETAQRIFDSVKIKEKQDILSSCSYNSSQIQELIRDYQLANPHLLTHNEFVMPEWTKNIAIWYTERLITNNDFKNAFSYLTENNIVQIPEIKENPSMDRLRDKLDPIDNIVCGWSKGIFSDSIFGITIYHFLKYG